MAIQFERRPMETLTSPQRPARNKKMVSSDKISNSEHQIHKFWSPKIAQHQKPVEEFKGTILSSLVISLQNTACNKKWSPYQYILLTFDFFSKQFL